MIPEDVEALVLADAAGALDPDEQHDLRGRVAALPPDVRREIAKLYDTTMMLAYQPADMRPSPGVRDRLLAALAEPAQYTVAAGDGQWNESGLPGIRVKILAVDRQRGLVTMLLCGDPGARYPAHRHSTPEECYVIRGSVEIGGRILRAGDFHHADGDSDHGEIRTLEGAEVLLVGAIDDYLPGAAHHPRDPPGPL
jgi:anti-sigma factor ChrR (cupin superfamily)